MNLTEKRPALAVVVVVVMDVKAAQEHAKTIAKIAAKVVKTLAKEYVVADNAIRW